MFDNDEAGQKAKRRVKDRYKDVANIKTMGIPEDFKDIDEFFRHSKDTEYVKYVIDTIKGFGE
jgi:DNA primase